MNCVSSQGSYGPWSNPAITLTKPLLLVPRVRITLQLSDLISTPSCWIQRHQGCKALQEVPSTELRGIEDESFHLVSSRG